MIDNLVEKIINSTIETYPYNHIVIENFIDYGRSGFLVEEEFRNKFNDDDLIEWGDLENNGSKWMIRDSNRLNGLDKILTNKKVIDSIQEKFELTQELHHDPSFEGGGLTLSPVNSFLQYHCDFNWSSKMEMYRVVNCLYYLNNDWKEKYGGCLHMLNSKTLTVEKIVEPIFNRLVILLTSINTPHGVSVNRFGFERLSFNSYLYSKVPPSEEQIEPHRTVWIGI